MKAFRHIPFQSHPNSNGFSVCLFLLCALFTGCQSTSTVLSDKAEQPAITQKKAGEQVIEALNRAYGVDTIGLFLDSPRCPDFVEGMFYEDSLPVFQIRGDTAKARRILEASAGAEPSGWKPTQSIPLPKRTKEHPGHHQQPVS